jgi:DNA-binding LacI/PurR family transcriptional regulator
MKIESSKFPQAGRPPDKRDDVVRALRKSILDGDLASGQRLPVHVELQAKLNCASATLQQALNILETDGFIRVEPRRGRFVVERPAYLDTFGLVFAIDPVGPYAEREWSRYFVAFSKVAANWQSASGRQLQVFHGIDQHADTEDRQRLVELIERHQLAGLIFANHPHLVANTPILDAPDLPRVVFSGAHYPFVSNLTFDRDQWWRKALQELSLKGRRKVAVLATGGVSEVGFTRELQAHGMRSLERWRQFVSMETRGGAANAVELLMNDQDRPDALIVADDNFVEPALAGLRKSGVRVPEDVAVVAHANFPCPPDCVGLDVSLLGYDLGAAFESSVSLIDNERTGRSRHTQTTLPALWERELNASPALSRSPSCGRNLLGEVVS